MSNLPDGVTEDMIPGNTPEDVYHERIWEGLCSDIFDSYESDPVGTFRILINSTEPAAEHLTMAFEKCLSEWLGREEVLEHAWNAWHGTDYKEGELWEYRNED